MIRTIASWFRKERPFFFMMSAVLWQILFFIVPLLLVLSLSFCNDDFSSVTLQYFHEVAYLPQLFIILRSIGLATATSLITLLIAYPVAYFITFRVKKYKFLFLFLLMLPFLINLLVQVYSWFFILEIGGFLNTILLFLGILKEPIHFLDSYGVIYVVMVHIYLPFMIMPLYSILEKLDHRLIEASYDLGASPTRTFMHVIFPLTLPGIQAGFFMVFVTAFGEYIIPTLIGGNKKFFVGTLIAEYFFIGKDWHAGAAFICMSILLLFLFSLLYYFILRKLAMRSCKG